MRVGIDYRPALLAKSGIGRYVEGLVRGLAEIGHGPALTLYGVMLSAPRRRDRVPEGLRAFLRPLPGRLADGLGRVGLTPDRAAGGHDVWHHTDFVVARTSCPAVVTLHDVLFLRDAAWHGPRRTRNLRRVLDRARARATCFVVPSERAARDAESLAGIPRSRLRVVPHGCDPAWILAAEPERRARPYLLAVGSLEPRKNLPRLVEAHAALRADRPELELLVVGAVLHLDEATRAALRRPGVRALGRVPDVRLAGLIRGAAALAYVSLVEGFGLPVLEGLAAGVPVVTSRGTAMEEVATDAAVLVDPGDARSIETGLRQALDEPEPLAAAGPARAARYTWAGTARATWAVYEEAAG
jgi:glycosyltransferase involved in cell wall biosynthesis